MSVIDDFRLDGRCAFVTGGGSGIGSAIAIALADAGANVAVLDINADAAGDVARRVRELDRQALALRCDVTAPYEVEAAIEQVAAEFDRLDIAVNSAGIAITVPALEMTVAQWDQVLDVNLRGVFLCARKAGEIMAASGAGGSILNLASMSARIVNHPQPHCAYNASKAGVVQLTKSLASEWAATGVRVNSLSPGYTRTPLTAGPAVAGLRDHWTKLTPIGRMAEVEDLIGAAVFLASDAARYVTGHDLVVDGGYTVR